jgi:hypothetical protein
MDKITENSPDKNGSSKSSFVSESRTPLSASPTSPPRGENTVLLNYITIE